MNRTLKHDDFRIIVKYRFKFLMKIRIDKKYKFKIFNLRLFLWLPHLTEDQPIFATVDDAINYINNLLIKQK